VLLALQLGRPLVFGVANGAGFGLVAIGLVLIYKSTRVFNFAAGEFVTVGAYGVYVGYVRWDLPYPAAMLLGVVAGLLVGLLTERLVVRPLADRPKVTILVATAAVAIVIIPIEILTLGANPFQARPAFVNGVTVFGRQVVSVLGPTIFGVKVSPQIMLVVLALLVAGAVLAWFFGRTDLGLATLATSQESTASRLVGIRLNRISMLTWGAAGLLGGIAGVLLPPITATFTPGFGTTSVLISAFTAAVLGGMTSVPGAFVGGVLVGVVQSFAQTNFNSVPGAGSVAILITLIAVLLVRPTGLLGREA
jgi:branched-chain amino acid transport system permease protein